MHNLSFVLDWLQCQQHISTTYVTFKYTTTQRWCNAFLLALIAGYTCRRHRQAEKGKQGTQCAGLQAQVSIKKATVQ